MLRSIAGIILSCQRPMQGGECLGVGIVLDKILTSGCFVPMIDHDRLFQELIIPNPG